MPPTKPRTTARKPRKTVLRLDRQENVDAYQALIADREPLFSIGEVEYTIPKQAPTAWTVRTAHVSMTEGDVAAANYAMFTMLGEAGAEALASCETLTMTDFERIRDVILKRVLPGEDDPKS